MWCSDSLSDKDMYLLELSLIKCGKWMSWAGKRYMKKENWFGQRGRDIWW